MNPIPSAPEAASRPAALHRRKFLRGLGACISLPALASFCPGRLLGAGDAAGLPGLTPAGAPLRTAFVYFPNGAIPASWWPEGGETDFQLGPTLQPLEAFRKDLQILGGLDHKEAYAGKDGGGDHARA
ncbi:MAG: DUF1552 domain-containing protein, partial [Verrucomicrobia bacterium]|nr:DUF1552 domain-containing protein [Verrucomicrobiota bacterium]